MTASRGFVLVNALIIVAALSVVSVWLLSRAETGRARAAAVQEAVQLELYLDAYENLALKLLDDDLPTVDDLSEAWAREDHELALDRGRIAGRIEDLNSRFNVNWLANPEAERARAAFDRLALTLGLQPKTTEIIVAAITGTEEPDRDDRRRYVEIPPRGPVVLVEQLAIPPSELAILRPYLAALPADSRLNVNTASEAVLSSLLLPDGNPSALTAVLARREQDPYESVSEFNEAVMARLGDDFEEQLAGLRLSVNSDWFVATAVAELGGYLATRRAIVRRNPLPAGAMVAYREDSW